MTKLHQPHGRADSDTAKGELRKPDDYSDQPGQDAPERADSDGERASVEDPATVGTSPREYGHSSGDRNTKHDEDDWPGFEGGTQRDASPDAPTDSAKRPDPKR